MEMRIEILLRERELYNARFKNDVELLRNACRHTQVLHWDGTHKVEKGSILEPDPKNPIRICLTCRFEEEGSWWSYAGTHWNTSTYSRSIVLGNDVERTVRQVDFDEFSRMRVLFQ
jgi:hypothetical protein